MKIPTIILGAGGHAKVLIDALGLLSVPVIGVTDVKKVKGSFCGVRIIGNDEAVFKYKAHEILLVNGLGSIADTTRRGELFCRFKGSGYSFATIVHPSAVVAGGVEIGEGVQIMAGAVVQTSSSIGDNTIVNTKASIDHDCAVGQHVHLAPGVILSGGVKVGDGAHVGTGAIIIQDLSVGANAVIGAGAVVVRSVIKQTRVFGVPAKEVE